jgi:hypothetical protein
MAEKNPFVKDYAGDVASLKTAMAYVALEISEYLFSKYGPLLRDEHVIYLAAILTSGWLLGLKTPLDAYLPLLRQIYEEMKEAWLSGEQ